MEILCIYHDNAWYPPQVAEYSYDCLIGFRHMLHGFQIDKHNGGGKYILYMFWGNLSEDDYGTQRFLADLSFKSVTVEVNPNTNDLYLHIQYQCSIIDWLLREYGNVEVSYDKI